MTGQDPETIRIGVSSCLLGESVRFNGGHKRDSFLADLLSRYVEYIPVCPEVEVGMGTPRESVRLVGDIAAPRMVGTRSATDHTVPMRAYARRRARELDAHDLCGYILKKDSPSCGMERVKVYPVAGGTPTRKGMGLFAAALRERHPLLPLEEEGRLKDPRLRENFIERVFAYRALKTLFASRYRRGALVEFHTAFKFLLLAHSPVRYRELGRIVAAAKEAGAAKTRESYGRVFMEAMAETTTTRKHTNVLMHLAGFFKKTLDEDSRQELATAILDYRAGLIPLIVPVILVRHHARRLGATYLLGQVYLEPHPKELMLRNHV